MQVQVFIIRLCTSESTYSPVQRRSIADEKTKRDGGELYFGKLDGFNSTEFASSARGQVTAGYRAVLSACRVIALQSTSKLLMVPS
jgi:hypothetical protein